MRPKSLSAQSIGSLVILALCVGLAACAQFEPHPQPNESRSPSNDPLSIHIIPHTHDDLGWLKTVEEYYYGTNHYITQFSVKKILDTVIVELLRNPSYKFMYVEMGFFYK